MQTDAMKRLLGQTHNGRTNQHSFTTSTSLGWQRKQTDRCFAINVSKDIEGSVMLRETAGHVMKIKNFDWPGDDLRLPSLPVYFLMNAIH